jgi:ribosomal protein L37AE/L43A
MPWVVEKIMEIEERTPACPDCGGRLTVRHVVSNLFHCTGGTLFRAVWTDPPRVVKAQVKTLPAKRGRTRKVKP